MGKYKLSFGIIILGFVVYGRMLFNGFVGDDLGYINHPYIKQFQIIKFFQSSSADLGGTAPTTGSFYRPLMLVIFSFIYKIQGNVPFVYHLIQLVIHLFNVSLIYLLLLRFTKKTTAYALSLIYLVHPINAETVVYVSNLQDGLFVFFGLLALNLTIYKLKTWKNLLLISVLLLLSLLAKETGILFIICCIAYIWLFSKAEIKNFRWYIFMVLGIYGYMRFLIAGVGIGKVPQSIMGTLSLGERLLQIPKIISYYLVTLFFPKDLAFGQTWVSKDVFGPLILVLGMILSVIIFYKNINFKDYKKNIFFGIWFLTGMALHLQIIPLEMTVADRWFYFPFIGLLGIIGINIKKIPIIALGLILSLLAARTWVREGDWKSPAVLYNHDTKITQSYLLEQAYGYELMQENKLTNAYPHLIEAVNIFRTSADTNTLGVYYYRLNNIPEAIKWFEMAVSIGNEYLAYNNLSRLLLSYRSPEEAEKVILIARKLFPDSDTFWYLSAIADYKKGEYKVALSEAERAYSISQSQQNLYILTQLQKGLPLNINN